LNAVLPEVRANGAAMVVISPQLPEFLRDLKAKSNLAFDLLHDSGNKVAEAYGLAMALPDDLIAVYRKIGVARQLRCPVSDSEDVRSLRIEKMT
jgi:peroxiredoxin